MRRLASLKVLPGLSVVVGQLESAVRVGERVSPLCLPPLDFTLRPTEECVVTGASATRWGHLALALTLALARWTAAARVRRRACSHEEASAGEVVCTEPVAVAAGWAGALACEDSGGRWLAAGVYSNAAAGQVRTTFASLLDLAAREAVGEVITRGLVFRPSPPPDACAARRCVLGRCLEPWRVCDRIWDCVDGADERGCDYTRLGELVPCRPAGGACSCPAGYGRCANALCLPKARYCDGTDDCGDGSDEADCADCAATTTFLSPSKLCDGRVDCPDSGDEAARHCAGCTAGEFRCDVEELGVEPTCVLRAKVCLHLHLHQHLYQHLLLH